MRLFFFLLLLSLAVVSCSNFKNPDHVPAYLHLSLPEVAVTQAEGSTSHKITELWLYVDNVLYGAVQPGKSYPIIQEGMTHIRLYGGIRENAIDELPVIYPMYDSTIYNVVLQAGRTDTIHPVIRYNPRAKFVFVENFENDHIFGEDLDKDPATQLRLTTENVFEGNRSARMNVSKDNSWCAVGTNLIYMNLPANGTAVYLEMDYFTDVPFYVGLVGYDDINIPEPYYKLLLNPQPSWNKVYVRLTEELQILRRNGYRIAFQALYDSTYVGTGQTEQNVYLDNVKLLHY